MTSALFGATGFVGGNILASQDFDARYSSANAAESAGRAFSLVVFSAAKAEKWRINADPEGDQAHIADLERLLAGITAEQFVLVSTVDVFRVPIAVDERTAPDLAGLHPYGLHRLQLENSVRERFPGALVVRLPGLFGAGLKKNVIFDLLNNNNISRINPASAFQYYDLRHLWGDIQTALAARLKIVNLVSAPVLTADLARVAFGRTLGEYSGPPAVQYDVHTVHAELLGGRSRYVTTAQETVDGVRKFVTEQRYRGN